MFHLVHLDKFSNLHTLYLHRYNFRWGYDDETAPLVRLQTLKLDKCSWEYPFNLASFNQNNTLRTLRVIYSHDNTFVLLEQY